MTYLRDPKAIYDLSFATIRSEARLEHLPTDAHDIAVRVIHACGMTEIADDLVISRDFASAASAALQSGATIFCDVEMVKHGIIKRQIHNTQIICTLNDDEARAIGISKQTTRSAAAVELWLPRIRGSIAVIGNAPTALFALLELISKGAPAPAAIVGLPVGFVGAAESKDALIAHTPAIPFFTLSGRRGGSAMAAAVVNALLERRQ